MDTAVEITRRVIDDKTCVVALDGILNASSADEVKEIFRQVADDGMRQVVLDLERMHSIDSSGLAALISGLKA
jgi:anti-sigma B factor antagonist